jgi:signal transduction histidine kinase
MGMRSAFERRWNTIGVHLVALVVVQIILVGGTIFFGAREDFARARLETEARTLHTARLAADFVVEELETSIDGLADTPTVLAGVGIDKLCEIRDSQEEDRSVRWFHTTVHILREDGNGACASDSRKPSVAREPWFTAARASDEPVSSGPQIDPVTHKNAMIYAVYVPDGAITVVYSNELDSVGPALDNQFGAGTASPAFMITTADRTTEIASSGRGTGRSTVGTGFAHRLTRTRNTFAGLDSVERIYAEAAIPDVGWRLFAGTATEDAFAAAREAVRERAMLGVVVALLVLFASFVLSRRFVRPIRAVAKTTRSFGAGELDARVNPSGPFELAELGRAVNEMMDVRAEAEVALQKAFKSEQNAAEELREVDQMRNAFLMAISHELRTPLTSIVGYSTFLDEALKDLEPTEVESSIKAIATQSKRLERLLLDLLDIERLSRGTIEPNLTDTDVRQLVMRMVESTSAHGRIRVDIPKPVPANVDAALVERIVENLVMNAIKHTPPTAKIWARAVRRNGHVLIKVDDSGNGVPDELKESIFQAFEQGDVPEHSPGTGVGLALVAQFAKLHGGRAWVEDRRGGGASFRVELPAKPRTGKPGTQHAA